MAIIKNKKKCVGRDVGKLVGMYNSAAAVEKQASGSKKKKSHMRSLYGPAIPLLGMYTEELKAGAGTDSGTPKFTQH